MKKKLFKGYEYAMKTLLGTCSNLKTKVSFSSQIKVLPKENAKTIHSLMFIESKQQNCVLFSFFHAQNDTSLVFERSKP